MNIDLPSALGTAAGAITALSGIYAGFRHIRYSLKAKKDAEREAILKQANDEMKKIQYALESKINDIESKVESQKETIARDLAFMKETHISEIKVLGDKIEDLREQLNIQYSQLIGLLTKLIDNK